MKSCLTNSSPFYIEVTGLVDMGIAVDMACLNISKVFNTVSHSTLMDKLTK